MALILNDKSPSSRTQTESGDLIAGADDCMLIGVGETIDAVANNISILAFVVNSAGTVTSLLANDGNNTNVAGAGLTKGSKNIISDLSIGTFMQAGKYALGNNWNGITTGTASVIIYYKYITSSRAELWYLDHK